MIERLQKLQQEWEEKDAVRRKEDAARLKEQILIKKEKRQADDESFPSSNNATYNNLSNQDDSLDEESDFARDDDSWFGLDPSEQESGWAE